jgi:phenol 2-monooxygenase (NADPH)
MQFYRDGYRPGDPDVLPASRLAVANEGGLPAELDVLIVGTGPAGTVLGAQLAAFPGIRTRIIERREGPLKVGRADGVACRTVEMFQAFGLADALVREAYWVNEVRFWGPSDADRSRIVRTGWVEDTPDGLSEFPHVIVNQARMQQYLLDHMARSEFPHCIAIGPLAVAVITLEPARHGLLQAPAEVMPDGRFVLRSVREPEPDVMLGRSSGL